MHRWFLSLLLVHATIVRIGMYIVCISPLCVVLLCHCNCTVIDTSMVCSFLRYDRSMTKPRTKNEQKAELYYHIRCRFGTNCSRSYS